MRTILCAACLLLLAGCTSVPMPQPAGPALMLIVGDLSAAVESVLAARPDAAPEALARAAAQIDAARAEVVARLAAPGDGRGLGAAAAIGALGATIALCEDGLARLGALQRAGADTAIPERRLRLSCLLPLGLMRAAG